MNNENESKIIRIHENREVVPGFPLNFRFLADGMMRMNAIRFGDYDWTLHGSNPDAPKGPMYFELRAVRGDVALRKLPVIILSDLTKDLRFEILAEIPTSITPTATIIAEDLDVPMVSARPKAKDRGSGVLVDGFVMEHRGKTALLVDDILARGDAALDAIKKLENVGLVVEDAAFLMDYEIGGKGVLQENGYFVHSAFTAEQLLDYLYKSRQVSTEIFDRTKNRFDEMREYFRKK
jgi:orotate phosphoribosyltransferase